MKCVDCVHRFTDSSDDPFVPYWVNHKCTKKKTSLVEFMFENQNEILVV